MNSGQKTALWIGIIVITLMGIYPPWIITHTWGAGISEISEPGGYSLIFSPPQSEQYSEGVKVDIVRLFIQWMIVAVITGGAIVTLKDKKTPLPPLKST